MKSVTYNYCFALIQYQLYINFSMFDIIFLIFRGFGNGIFFVNSLCNIFWIHFVTHYEFSCLLWYNLINIIYFLIRSKSQSFVLIKLCNTRTIIQHLVYLWKNIIVYYIVCFSFLDHCLYKRGNHVQWHVKNVRG